MKKLQDSLKETMENILAPLASKVPRGINTGFFHFDNMLQGINKGTLTILASKPGSVKTSFALNIVKNLVRQQTKILFASDLSASNISSRLLAITSGVQQKANASYTPAEMMLLLSAEETLQKLPLFFAEHRGINEIFCAETSNLHAEQHLEVLIADNVRTADCRSLKTLAGKLDIAVLALVPIHSRKDEIMLKGIADKLITLQPDNERSADPDLGVPLELVISKNKQGHCGTCRIYMIPPVMLFKESRTTRDPFVAIPDVHTPVTPYGELKKYITPDRLPLLEHLRSEIPQEGETVNLSDVLRLSACLEAVGDHENAVKVFMIGRKNCPSYEKGAEVIFDWMFAAMYYWLFLDMENAVRCMAKAQTMLDSRTVKEYSELEARMQKYRPTEWIKDDEIC